MSVVGVGGRSASGAELIRQLSCAKLEQYSSTESLKRSPTTKTPPSSSMASVVAAVAMGRPYHPPPPPLSSTGRPMLLRQSTTTSETVSTTQGLTSAASRRQLLNESRKNWRSCDDRRHHQTHLRQPQHHRSPVKKGSTATNSVTSLGTTTGIDPLPPLNLGLHNAQVYYYSKKSLVSRAEEDLDVGDVCSQRRRPEEPEEEEEEDRVVLPPLATRLQRTSPTMTIAVVMPQRVLAKATESVLGLASGGGKNNNKLVKTQRQVSTCSSNDVMVVSSSGGSATATTAVATITGNGNNSPARGGGGTRLSLTAVTLGHRRRLRGMIILTTFFLFLIALFLVGVTLRMAPLIDELGKTILFFPFLILFKRLTASFLLFEISRKLKPEVQPSKKKRGGTVNKEQTELENKKKEKGVIGGWIGRYELLPRSIGRSVVMETRNWDEKHTRAHRVVLVELISSFTSRGDFLARSSAGFVRR